MPEPDATQPDDEIQIDAYTVASYNAGRYEDAYVGLCVILDEHPWALHELFSVVYTCERVLRTLPDAGDLPHLGTRNPVTSSRWDRVKLRLSNMGPVRCKWCGHFTPYINPHRAAFENTCRNCSSPWPAPSWIYDTPDWMAMSEGRESWLRKSMPSRIWNGMFTRYENEVRAKRLGGPST